MSADIIDGKAYAAELRAKVGGMVPAFRAVAGRAPGLAVVLVGEDPASQVYVRSKGKATIEAGMESIAAMHRSASRNCSISSASSMPTRRSTASSSSCLCPTISTRIW